MFDLMFEIRSGFVLSALTPRCAVVEDSSSLVKDYFLFDLSLPCSRPACDFWEGGSFLGGFACVFLYIIFSSLGFLAYVL